MDLFGWLAVEDAQWGAALIVAAHVAAAVATTAHVLVSRGSPRSAIGWTALVWLSPFVGATVYVLLGVNRVRRKALRLRPADARFVGPTVDARLPDEARFRELAPLKTSIDRITQMSLLQGNTIEPLLDGDETFPAMLEAIDGARHTLTFMTFIFDSDPWGQRFVDALARARGRGVEVRLLIDGVGTWFSWPPALGSLRRAGVPFARFLWSLDPRRMALLNLRNHRKILVADGRLGFTGGMNVRGSFVGADHGDAAHRDLHIRVRGPLVGQLQELFAVDWAYTTGEVLQGAEWFPELGVEGDVLGRVIPDGPDEDLDKAALALFAAVTCARHSVRVMTPYFLPEEPLQVALAGAARRGVEVDVIVPSPSNHPWVDAAMRAELCPLLEHGVRVWAQPHPFDHSKVVVVDDVWCCFGSANWDPRSLRLNFEMLVEAWDRPLAKRMAEMVDARRARSRAHDAQSLRTRPSTMKLLDGLARLAKPYL